MTSLAVPQRAGSGHISVTATGADRAIRVSTAVAVLAVAGIAAYVSYWHAYAVVRARGGRPSVGFLWRSAAVSPACGGSAGLPEAPDFPGRPDTGTRYRNLRRLVIAFRAIQRHRCVLPALR